MPHNYKDVKRETYTEEDHPDSNRNERSSSFEHEIKPIESLQLAVPPRNDDQNSQPQAQHCNEFVYDKGSVIYIKEEQIEDFVKEEVDISPNGSEDAASICGSAEPTQCNTFELSSAMADSYEVVKREWSFEETYAEGDNFNPKGECPSPKIETGTIEEPPIKTDPDSPPQYQHCNEFLGDKGSVIYIKEEDIEDFVEEEDDVEEATSSCDSIQPTQGNTELDIRAETVVKKIDNLGEKSHGCTHCSKQFSLKQNMQRHLLTHFGEKPHECLYCSKQFSLKQNLTKHLLTHTGEKPYECPHCSQQFRQREHLQRHLLSHTGGKLHECPYCIKKFCQKQNLQSHLLTHSGEKPHVCPLCSKKFIRKENLQVHLFTHTGEKPYECPHCGRRFNRKQNMQKHILIHKGDRPHECLHCSKKYNWRHHLRRHLLTHTKEIQ